LPYQYHDLTLNVTEVINIALIVFYQLFNCICQENFPDVDAINYETLFRETVEFLEKLLVFSRFYHFQPHSTYQLTETLHSTISH